MALIFLVLFLGAVRDWQFENLDDPAERIPHDD
ncbi:MAG: cbb3-type cytochrome oxidase assembly protein [Longimicrobiales bacterium]